jgi:hypothetical protein
LIWDDTMTHLLVKRPLPNVNIALVIALIWAALAVGAAVFDVGRMLQAW